MSPSFADLAASRLLADEAHRLERALQVAAVAALRSENIFALGSPSDVSDRLARQSFDEPSLREAELPLLLEPARVGSDLASELVELVTLDDIPLQVLDQLGVGGDVRGGGVRGDLSRDVKTITAGFELGAVTASGIVVAHRRPHLVSARLLTTEPVKRRGVA